MKVSEIFYSLQGEGFLTGVPSVFIRLSGCPLRCRWCDTKYAWDTAAGKSYEIEKIVQAVQQFKTRFVVITGGEPMQDLQLSELIRLLKVSGKHITIETSGITFVPELACDLMSISPKLSNSTPTDAKLAAIHEDLRLDLTVLASLIKNYKYQLKFVIDSADDLPEIKQLLERMGTFKSERVMLMPQAETKDQLLAKYPMVADLCKQTGFTLCQRMQILLWNNEKGK